MRKYLYLVLSCIIFLFSSCKEPDLKAAYLQIDLEDVNNCVDVTDFNETHALNYDAEQLASLQQHNFTHVNLYVNGRNLGCWQLPCKVPILGTSSTDSTDVVILPCFRKTGMANTVQGYPFFNVLQKRLPLRPGETYDLSQNPLVYVYSPIAHFPYLETFNNSSSFTPNDSSSSSLSFQPTIIDGRSVGAITLNDGNGQHFIVESTPVTLPTRNYFVYLEVTYKTEANIEIGLKISTGAHANTVHPVGGIYSSDGEWKTIYFDLASIITSYNYTGAAVTNAILDLEGSGEKGKETHFYIDNIKIIYEPSV